MSAQWEHEHCDFCWATVLDADYSAADRKRLEKDADLLPGSYTEAPGGEQPAGEHWICPRCFEDFREEFAWEVVSSDPEGWPYALLEPHPRPTAAEFKPDAVVVRPTNISA